MLKDATLLRSAALVGDTWINATSNDLAVVGAATGEENGHVPVIDAAGVHTAIEAAETAQKLWAARPARERSIVLRNWFDLVVENADDLAEILTREQGEPLTEAKGEVL